MHIPNQQNKNEAEETFRMFIFQELQSFLH